MEECKVIITYESCDTCKYGDSDNTHCRKECDSLGTGWEPKTEKNEEES